MAIATVVSAVAVVVRVFGFYTCMYFESILGGRNVITLYRNNSVKDDMLAVTVYVAGLCKALAYHTLCAFSHICSIFKST